MDQSSPPDPPPPPPEGFASERDRPATERGEQPGSGHRIGAHDLPPQKDDSRYDVDFPPLPEDRLEPQAPSRGVDDAAAEKGSPESPSERTLIFHRFDPAAPESLLPLEGHPPATIETGTVGPVTAEPFAADSDETQQTEAAEPEAFPTESVNLASEAGRSITITQRRQPERRPDPIRHGLVMLLTVVGMLATARYVLPGIVEEIRYAQHRGQLRAEFEVANEGLKNVSLDTLSQAYQMVNAAAGPCVVHIDIHRTNDQRVSHSEVPGAPRIPISDQGSGVVVDAEGYILTNRHVIASSDEITVTLSDGRIVEARVIGTDEMTDLAVLKVDADRLIPIPWGDSERIRVGSPVWAIGSPFGLDRTVTFGILSGKHRIVRAKDRYQDFMQSDVAVNPGNSGGPLVDSRGTLIGINTAIVGDTYQGVSFAIPSDVARKIYETLRESGSIERGWLGVSLNEVPDELLTSDNHRIRGALISALADRNSGAARAGLKAGDIVVRVDDEPIRDVDHLMQVIGNAMAGSNLLVTIVRDGKSIDLPVSLGARPPIPVR